MLQLIILEYASKNPKNCPLYQDTTGADARWGALPPIWHKQLCENFGGFGCLEPAEIYTQQLIITDCVSIYYGVRFAHALLKAGAKHCAPTFSFRQISCLVLAFRDSLAMANYSWRMVCVI